jgi:hypothetical protein
MVSVNGVASMINRIARAGTTIYCWQFIAAHEAADPLANGLIDYNRLSYLPSSGVLKQD